jgi:hyperosmotically inducible periplasmic protein
LPANGYALKIIELYAFFTALINPNDHGKTMKIKLAKTCIIIGAALAPIVAHAADQDSDRKDPMAYVKDSVITAKIKAKLAEEKIGSLASITVDTDANGKVYLGGTVKSEQEADNIIFFVHRIEGVTAVRSTFRIPGDK